LRVDHEGKNVVSGSFVDLKKLFWGKGTAEKEGIGSGKRVGSTAGVGKAGGKG